MKILFALLLFLCVFAVPASDHVDGPVTIEHPMADLVDLFAFPSPKRPGALVLILNVYPFVPWNGHFGDRIDYRILLRAIDTVDKTSFQFHPTQKPLSIDCRFDTPRHGDHWANCSFPHGQKIRFAMDSTGRGDGFSAFAGKRADPFLFNVGWFDEIVKQGHIPKKEVGNDSSNLNVLSLIFEVDVASVLGKSPTGLWAVAAESLTRDQVDGPSRRIDRVGRPELSNARLAAFAGQDDLRKIYNEQDSFAMDNHAKTLIRQRLLNNIDYFDQIDGINDWGDQKQQFADLLLNDYLIVDPGKDFHMESYFSIENALLRRQPHSRAGGRVPGDNVIEALLTNMINAGHGRQIDTGIAAVRELPQPDFPYLADAHWGIIALFKPYFATRAAVKLSTRVPEAKPQQ